MKKDDGTITGTPDLSGVLDFLKALSANNDRDWFNARKDEYLQAKAKVESFTAWLVAGMLKFDKELALVDPRKCMYRIYRDIRFSNDKRPYKDFMGIFISKEGRHGACSGYYIHLQPGRSWYGAGVYGLPPEKQKKVRDGIYFQAETLKKILSSTAMKRVYGGKMDESARMKVAPKGYAKDFPDMDLLKYRYYFVSAQASDKQVSSAGFARKVLDDLEAAWPFNEFLNEALDF